MTFGPMTCLLYVTCVKYVTLTTHVTYIVSVTLRSIVTEEPFLSFVALMILGHVCDMDVTCMTYL